MFSPAVPSLRAVCLVAPVDLRRGRGDLGYIVREVGLRSDTSKECSVRLMKSPSFGALGVEDNPSQESVIEENIKFSAQSRERGMYVHLLSQDSLSGVDAKPSVR